MGHLFSLFLCDRFLTGHTAHPACALFVTPGTDFFICRPLLQSPALTMRRTRTPDLYPGSSSAVRTTGMIRQMAGTMFPLHYIAI